jgi:hypothetical protein
MERKIKGKVMGSDGKIEALDGMERKRGVKKEG